VTLSEDSGPGLRTEVNKYIDLTWEKMLNEFEFQLNVTIFWLVAALLPDYTAQQVLAFYVKMFL
jgi:hypothetical protein